MVLPKNYDLPYGYTMQNVTAIHAVQKTNIVLCKLQNGSILVLKPYGLHGRYPCTMLWRGRYSNRSYEFTRKENEAIKTTVDNI